MTTVAAGNVAGHAGDKDKDKEKVEKRRALGRGLASLLPGPRVVPPAAGGDAGTRAGAPATHAPERELRSTGQPAAAVPTLASAVPDSANAVETATRTGVSAPHSAARELALAGQPGAAVPTQASAVATENQTPSLQTQTPSQSQAAAGHIPSMAAQTAPSEFPGVAPVDLEAAAFAADASADSDAPISLQAQAESRIPGNLVVNIAIADIDKNPFQTRYVEDDDALEELADSIKANGVVQPIMVRPSEEDDGRYVLILGERRLHASKKAGKTHIPAMVRRVSLQQAAEMTIIENLQREDLSPLEQAEAFRVLSNEFKLTQQQIGERVGLSRVSIANYMRLLKLPREVMQLLAEKRITFAKAKELLKLEGNDRIAEAALYAVKKGMNIEQIEMLVLRMDGLLDPLPDMPGVEPRKSSGARWVDPNVRAAQTDMERMLGVRVRIRDRKGKGKIVIEYSNVDDYERVVEMIRGKK